jgi:hypothetical protein
MFFTLFGSTGLDACTLFCNQKKTAFFSATSEFSFPSKLWDPFAVVVEEETKEIRIPATELTHDGSFLYALFPLLGKSLVGDFGSIILHDTDHITICSNT